MSKITREDIANNAWAIKVTLSDEELDYCLKEVTKFFDDRPDLEVGMLDDDAKIEPLRYVNSEVINVFSAGEEKLISAEELLSNTLDREGNYVKIPKVLK